MLVIAAVLLGGARRSGEPGTGGVGWTQRAPPPAAAHGGGGAAVAASGERVGAASVGGL